jgi:peptidylprolyl isomerase
MNMPSARCRFSSCALLFSVCACVCALACNPAAPPAADKTQAANAPAKPATPTPAADADIPAPPDVAAPPADAERTSSGLATKLLEKGTGEARPKPWDQVKAHYTGWTTDGKMFDSSYLRNEPSTFMLTGVIAGWTDGLQVMTPGDRVRFWIPEELAYKGQPGKPQGMLVFEIELLEIAKTEAK